MIINEVNKIETLSFKDILQHTDDIFEAVVMLGRRSRQIVDRQVSEQITVDTDYTDDEYAPVEMTGNPDYIEFDKPPVLAMDDFLAGRLEWRYGTIEDNDDAGQL